VVIESYRPGVAKTFGIDAETLRAVNPRLIHCAISGYGSHSARSGHDLNFTALSGLLDYQRDHEGRPTLPSSQLGDVGGALFAALLIVAAIHERDRTGAGGTIDLSLAAAARAVIPTAEVAAAGGRDSPLGLVLTGGLPNYEIYETADGGYLSVACLEPRFWDAFCRAIGHPELVVEEFHESAWPKVRKTISDTLRSRTRAEWEAVFAEVDACIEPMLTVEEARERFGPSEATHPLTVNVGAPAADAEALGESFADAAALAGYSSDDIRALSGSQTFKAKSTFGRILSQAKQLLHRGSS
jgi:crotonobetainyl-CoA:carnitine CoA-transferase CaiB-like acyl-CoA transferase